MPHWFCEISLIEPICQKKIERNVDCHIEVKVPLKHVSTTMAPGRTSFICDQEKQNYPLQFMVSVIPKHRKVLGHATTRMIKPKRLILPEGWM